MTMPGSRYPVDHSGSVGPGRNQPHRAAKAEGKSLETVTKPLTAVSDE